MLVLGRKKGQDVVINHDVVVTVVDIRGDKVSLGVQAPKSVPVHRREVYDAIKASGEDMPAAVPICLPLDVLAKVEQMAAGQDVDQFLSDWITVSVRASD